MLRLLTLLALLLFPLPGSAQGIGQGFGHGFGSGAGDNCNPGQRRCGHICCPASHRCSWDGHCVPPGGNYCGGGFSCPRGQICINAGRSCAPHGSTRCSDGTVCGPGQKCSISGGCARPNELEGLDLTRPDPQTGCLPGGGCSPPGWFRCDETGSQCRPGFKCSKGRGCVPVKALDCGFGKWCRPGEICLEEGGCAPAGGDKAE